MTINIVNPVAGANTPGMAEGMRQMSREGRAPRLVEPEEMVPPLLYIVSCEADQINGWRFEIKWVFGFAKARYRGLKKNTHRLLVTCGLANLFMARRYLLHASPRPPPRHD